MHLMPNGKTTNSLSVYVAEWKKISQPLCDKYDLKVIGFDPGLLVCDVKSGASVHIPLWLAKRLAGYKDTSTTATPSKKK